MRTLTVVLTLLSICLLSAAPSYANLFGNLLEKAKQAAEQAVSETIPGNDKQATEPPPETAPAPAPAKIAPTKTAPATSKPVYDKVLVKQIQTRLNQLGYSAGAPDGLYGPGTRKAIEAFQSEQGLPVDGQPTQALLATLQSTQKPVKSATLHPAVAASGDRVPANEASLAMVRLRYDPSWLDDEERLYQLTRTQIGREKWNKGGIAGNPPLFDPAAIADREPEFAARELAPVMRQALVRIAARVGPDFYREVPWSRRTEYDFKTQTISYKKQMLKPVSAEVRSRLPANVKDRALYEIPRGASNYKEFHYGLAAGIEPAAEFLAFDRLLDLDKVPLAPKLAEKIASLDNQVALLLFRVTGTVGSVVLATVEGLEIRPARDEAPLLVLGPENFPSALAKNSLVAGPAPPVTRTFGEVVISAAEPDLADLLLLHYFPERLDDDYLLVLMQERQRFEQQSADPPWGRFFNPTGRTVDRADLATYGAAFKQWTMQRAARLSDRVTIRVERQRVGYDPNAQRASITFSSSSTCLEQRNVTATGAEFGIAVKATRDECGKQRYQWKRSPEVVIALDKWPMPPPPAVAAKLVPKYLPMEIAVEVTGKQPRNSGEGDLLQAKLREVRYYDAYETLVATVTPPAAVAPVSYDPLLRAKTGAAYGPDVVGVRLGMPLAAAAAAIRQHATVKDSFTGKAPFPFSGAHLYVLGDGGEFITLYTIQDKAGERVAALERNVWYLRDQAPADAAVSSALEDKYGTATEQNDSYYGFSRRWTAAADEAVLTRNEAKAKGCQGLVDSPKSMDVWKTDKGIYYWALPGLDKVWAHPTNGFSVSRDGKSAADIAVCGTELVASWAHNDGELHGPTLTIKLYDAPWMRAQAEAKQKKNASGIGL